MASVKRVATSSGSEGYQGTVGADERKRRRMLSNRESARRSRLRKQQHLDDLLSQVSQVQRENNEIVQHVNSTAELYVKVESENSVLRAQMMELGERLRSLNSLLCFVEEVGGFCMDIPEIPDPLLNPLQLSYVSQPIMASSNMFLI